MAQRSRFIFQKPADYHYNPKPGSSEISIPSSLQGLPLPPPSDYHTYADSMPTPIFQNMPAPLISQHPPAVHQQQQQQQQSQQPFYIAPQYHQANTGTHPEQSYGPAGSDHIFGMHPVRALRVCLGIAFGLILLLFSGVLIYALLSRDSHHHMAELAIDPLSTGPPVVLVAHGLTSSSTWKDFVYNFTSTGVLYEEQRHPASGSIADLVGDFEWGDVITDYNICCLNHEYRLLCLARSSGLNYGVQPLDGELDYDTDAEQVFVRLLVNSDQLLNVECFLTGRYFEP